MCKPEELRFNRATALSLLINAIIVWNTRYYQAIGEGFRHRLEALKAMMQVA